MLPPEAPRIGPPKLPGAVYSPPVERGLAIERRYDLEACVARGAFGEVLRARDRETRALVAIKRLHAHLATSDGADRIEHEANLYAAINSPHVVRCLGMGQDESGRPCLVLSWLAGQ